MCASVADLRRTVAAIPVWVPSVAQLLRTFGFVMLVQGEGRQE